MKTGIITNMSIRTSKNSKQTVLSQRSPVRTLLSSEFQAAIAWISRRKDKDGNRIGKITEAESVVKYEKDTFSLYARSTSGKSVSINDVRGEAVFLRRLPNGKIEMADVFVFCLGGGEYIISDWLTVWKAMDQLNHDHGTVVYMDAWRMNKDKFISLLKKAVSAKI